MAQNAVLGAVLELLLYLFVDAFLHVVCFHVGQFFVKALTLGKSPKYPHDNQTAFSILGATLLLGPPIIYLLWIS